MQKQNITPAIIGNIVAQVNNIDIIERDTFFHETERFVCRTPTGKELDSFAHKKDAIDCALFNEDYTPEGQKKKAIALLQNILCNSSIESEFDEEIFEFLDDIGEVPEGWQPYWN